MEKANLNYTYILNHFVVNSIFTRKQTLIIYNKILKEKRGDNVSAGSYYRQLVQCRAKARKVVWAILLLRLLNAVNNDIFSILNQLNDQLSVISNKPNDEVDDELLNNVISLVDDVIKRLVLI